MGKPTKRSANLQRKGLTADALLAQSYKQCKKRLAASTDRNYKDAQKLWDEYEPSISDIIYLPKILKWIRYCAYTGRPSLLQPGSHVPDVHQLKQFLHWWAGSSEGRIQAQVSVVSCEVVWARVQSVILQVTGNRVPTQVNTDVLAWIRTNLTQELCLTTERVKKGLCDLVVFTNLMKQLWCHDADEFEWERERVQTAFLLQIHMFTGGRPGAFVPTGYYPDIHLKYEDVEFLLIRVKDGQEKFGLVLRQGWRKGEKQMLDAKLRTLWTEDESMIYCPVTSFLALALADDAFVSIKSRSDLESLKLDGGEDVRVFPFKAEMHGKPFLVTRRGGTMPYSSWWYKLKSLSQRAGYMEYIRPYDIRRGTANKLDESSSVSTNSRNQLLGHSSDAIYQQYYQSDISAVDIKGIVLRGKADAGFDVQTLRRNRRLKRLPSRLPSREHQEFLANWRRLTWEGEASKDVCGKRARKQAWKALQKSWTETYVTVIAPEPPMQSKIPKSVERFGKLDEPTTLNAIMMQYDPHRKLIKEAALPTEYSLRASPILDSLSCLASKNYEHPAAWYPGTEPRRLTDKRTECRFCRKDFTTMAHKHQQQHVVTCASTRRMLSAEMSWRPRLCHRCNIWFDKLEDIRVHLKDHFDEIDTYCGILRLRSIVVSAGRCPFCLANSCWVRWGEYEKVVTAFTSSEDFKDHLKKHLMEIRREGESHHCPHPICSQENSYVWADLIHHFYDDHSITVDLFGTESFTTQRPPSVKESLFVPSDTEDSEHEAWLGIQETSARKRQKKTLKPREMLLKDLRG